MTAPAKQPKAWTTADEIEFIEDLGFNALERYVDACPRRATWGYVDSTKVMAFASRRLSLLRQRRSGR